MHLHLWHARTGQTPGHREAAAELLSAGERDRAAGFRFDADRTRFVLGRALLRTVLGMHLDRDARDLQFDEGDGRKPALAGNTDLGFNLSRSGEHLLCATIVDRRIGVDVETVRDLSDMDRVTAHVMSADERAAWLAGPEATRTRRFFTTWTRKEAILKANGRGIADGMTQLPIPADLPPGRAALVQDCWLLSDIEVDDPVSASVAVEARGPEREFVAFSDERYESGAEVNGLRVPRGVRLVVRTFEME